MIRKQYQGDSRILGIFFCLIDEELLHYLCYLYMTFEDNRFQYKQSSNGNLFDFSHFDGVFCLSI